MTLLDSLADVGWNPQACADVCVRVLGRASTPVTESLRFACEQVVPRILRTSEELDAIVAALNGRHVTSGPSGAPTRGRADVLPTGRNFYSVDPRALPSELSWEVGVRLADALLDRHRSGDRRAAADGRARRLGHGCDAHPAATTSPRSSRCSGSGRSGIPSRGG